MSFKPRILVFNKFYLPGYRAGGPIRTIANMVDRMSEQFEFFVVTSDRDSGDGTSYDSVVPNSWNHAGNAQVLYLSARDVALRKVQWIINEVQPDVIYLNSAFDAKFTLRVLFLKKLGKLGKTPVVLAPRGEFSEGALDLKRRKKVIFLSIAKPLRLFHDIVWHASSAYEKKDIHRALGFVKTDSIVEAMNLAPESPGGDLSSGRVDYNGPLRVCFLSRISPKKNLKFALRVFSNVKVDVKFTIYGPKEVPAYWEDCEQLITSLPPNIDVVYGGEVPHSEVKEVLTLHDLFFFPTKGENYGHVIQEALTAGLPVLISDQTPWMELTKKEVGWALSLGDEMAFAEVIEDVAMWSPAKREDVRLRAVSYAKDLANSETSFEANIALFKSVIRTAAL